ncbi:hypothetical protein QJS10_CPB21g00844 [Acorus calamus]|uniref:Uncharacterized protein n=1 Tax=Acorus calamus TaxID=4465 RepID=A0AAV9C4U0_ACOCL|nr:hypothetical protein QJS10_CPB21g00844 [Acorus calamus]
MRDSDCDGNTPLHLTVINQDPEMAYILWLNMPRDTSPVNNAGQTSRDILDQILLRH